MVKKALKMYSKYDKNKKRSAKVETMTSSVSSVRKQVSDVRIQLEGINSIIKKIVRIG